jgi:predicted amidohydrolase
MSRIITVAAAQLGAIQKADTRQAVVARMLALMDQAKAKGADFIVYPELALTTFFPRWYYEDRAAADVFFETEMPNAAVRPLFERAREHGLGDLGFPVWRTLGGILGMCICNDRRWPETFRVMGLQGVELVVLGFNTPAVNSQKGAEAAEKRIFHHRLSVQAGAYQNSTWVVAVAKAGVEDGFALFGASLIVNPDGEIVAESRSEDDEVIVYPCDLDATSFGKETIFDFKRHRRIEHYGRITAQTGVELPTER